MLFNGQSKLYKTINYYQKMIIGLKFKVSEKASCIYNSLAKFERETKPD